MGLKGNERDWRALWLEMQADGLNDEHCQAMMEAFDHGEVTPRKAVQLYRKIMDSHTKDVAKQEKKAEKEALIPRPDAFGKWS